MIKKISTDQLRQGMFVHDLNCGWLDHPFVRSQFEVEPPHIIKIKSLGIRELYIDTERGDDTEDATPIEQVRDELDRKIKRVAEQAKSPPRETSVREERTRVERVEKEARSLVTDLMGDIRLGKQIELERVNPVVEQMVDSVFRNKDALMSLSRIRQMDRYTYEHSVGVCVLMTSFARTLGLDKQTITHIGVGALLHDIGKMRTPDKILNKPGKLTDEEFVQMKLHVTYSRQILEETPDIDPIAIAVAAEHHERFDGSGYPNKLEGDQISLYGQMAAIVDVYDAITADRCYHKGMAPTEALRKIFEWSKFHFNPQLAQQFVQCVGIYPVGTLVMLESGRIGVVVEPGQQDLLHPTVRMVYDTGREMFINPLEVDLGRDGQDKIVDYADPLKWGIKPEVAM